MKTSRLIELTSRAATAAEILYELVMESNLHLHERVPAHDPDYPEVLRKAVDAVQVLAIELEEDVERRKQLAGELQRGEWIPGYADETDVADDVAEPKGGDA